MKISKMEATYVNHMGDDLSVVNAARVSFHKESTWKYDEWTDPPTGETVESAAAKGYPVRIIKHNPHLSKGDEKLINYLAKHKHFSPFNHAFMSFRIKAPIFVARQLVKHKFMPWNEVSRRYVDDEPEFFYPEVWRAKAENVKQGSADIGTPMQCFYAIDAESEKFKGHTELYSHKDVNELCLSVYRDMLDQGVAPEQARMVLPQNMMTEWIWSGTLGAYADMLRLRLDPHTQAESREMAQMIYKKVEELFPVSIKALLEA